MPRRWPGSMRSTCSASLGCLTMSTVDTTSLSLRQVAQHLSVKIVKLLSDSHGQLCPVWDSQYAHATLQCLGWPNHNVPKHAPTAFL